MDFTVTFSSILCFGLVSIGACKMNAEKYFNTRNLYAILELESSAQIHDVKRNYYKLARTYHPDRVASSEKEVAKEKFNIIHNAYSILSDATKKKLYDEGSNVLFTKVTMAAKWENFLKPVVCNDVDTARNEYQGSLLEKEDIIREFLAGNGSLTHMINNIPFMRIEDENRIIEIVKDLMDKKKLPKMSIKKLRK